MTVTGIDWDKVDGLLPVVVQDAATLQVLMLGYMNEEALARTEQTERVTFFSRSKKRLWRKGETSGHELEVERLELDCDGDALLVLARPKGPTCHRGTTSCFGDSSSIPKRPPRHGSQLGLGGTFVVRNDCAFDDMAS